MIAKIIYASIVFTGFLAIMNPIASISMFLSLTNQESEKEVKTIAFQSTMTAFLIVVIFSLAGYFLLNFFGVTYTALRLTGGILIAIIGYDMLQGNQSRASEETVNEGESVAISPLGIPLLAGPGVIITAMNFSTGGFVNCAITIGAFGLLCAITYCFFIFGQQIKHFVGSSILKAATRMMGLILMGIGIQMLIEGIYSAINEFHVFNCF